MNKLILTINKLQYLKNKYGLPEVQLPQIIVVGSQSSGKSSVMERIIGHDILPKASTLATRCPIVLQLINQEDMGRDVKAIFSDNYDGSNEVFGIADIAECLQLKTNKIGRSSEAVSQEPIIVQLYSSTHPTLTLIDLPGLIKNDGQLPRGSTEKIQELTELYAKEERSIILAISPANVDLANSDAIHVSEKHDPIGKRTLNVITKIDLMDRGTSISDILKSDLLKKSIGSICVVNRSQENVTNRLSIQEANDYERHFIASKSMDINCDHGIEYLTNTIVMKLEFEIQKHLPDIEFAIEKRIIELSEELKNDLDTINNKDKIIDQKICKFIDEYRKLIKGEKEQYTDDLIGGAKISHVLYGEYETEISTYCVTKRSKENILILLKNTAGHKRMSYSIENAFACIVRAEVDKFKESSLRCTDSVRCLLQEFVLDTIKECEADKYSNLAKKIEREMKAFIAQRHKFTTMIIENLIRCEKEDIFCLKPNTLMFDTLESKYNRKVNESKEKQFKDNIETTARHYGLQLTPQLRTLLMNSFNSKILGLLKDAVSQFQEDQNSALSSKTQQSKFVQALPTTLSDMVNNVTQNSTESKDMFIFLSIEKQFPKMINDLMEKSMKSEVIDGNENNPNVQVLEDMVQEYFKIVKDNFIRNVPKWIQTVFIKDILSGLSDALLCIRQEEDSENLLDISFDEVNRIRMKNDELEELKCVLEELKRLRKRR